MRPLSSPLLVKTLYLSDAFGYNKRGDKRKFKEKNMKKIRTLALIAHDQKKAEMVSWAMKNKDSLSRFNLCGTGTTAKLVGDATGLEVKRYLSGPLGGDQQIGAKIAEGEIDAVVFFWDPLNAQPHDPDVKALLRIAVVYDIPIATNTATANYVITSSLIK